MITKNLEEPSVAINSVTRARRGKTVLKDKRRGRTSERPGLDTLFKFQLNK